MTAAVEWNERYLALGVRCAGPNPEDRAEPFLLAMCDGNTGDEAVLAGDGFAPYGPGAGSERYRVMDLSTSEPVEPGASGVVIVPHDGWYRLEAWRDGYSWWWEPDD